MLGPMVMSSSVSTLDTINDPKNDFQGTVLAFDFGKRYIGIAIGEGELKLAHPLTTIKSHVTKIQFDAISKLITAWEPKLLVVGLPLHDDGTEHEMTRLSKLFARRLEGRYRINVVMVDERYTTRSARSALDELGINRKQQDHFIDQIAAQHILQSFFDHVPTTP